MAQDSFPVERTDEILKRPQDFRLLERIPLTMPGIESKFPIKLNTPNEGERIHHAVFLDTETTGMKAGDDLIIELGMVRCTYSFDRRILLSIDGFYDEFEDPHRKIPLEIQELTHITDDMVAGHCFDEAQVASLLQGRPLVIAHNAAFDRPFFDRRFPSLEDLSWACSCKGIDWSVFGDPGSKLEYLNMVRGWFYNAHRAYIDCLATIWLMHIEPQAFSMLIENALRKTYRVHARGNTFDIKDQLKERGYRFDGSTKCWYVDRYSKEESDREISWLQGVYDASAAFVSVQNAKTKFKDRIL